MIHWELYHLNIFIVMILYCMQLLLLFHLNHDQLFHHSTLGREASRETLRELVQSLLQLLLDERTCELPDGENVIRAINSLCVRIIDSANGTRVLR